MQRTDNSGFQFYRSKQVHKMPWYENVYESSIIDSHLLNHCKTELSETWKKDRLISSLVTIMVVP